MTALLARALTLLVALIVFTGYARADCTLVSNGQTRPSGAIIHNVDYHVLQFCDGTVWKAFYNTEASGGGSCFDTWTARDSNRDWAAIASSSDGTKLVAAVSVVDVGEGTFTPGRIYTSTDSGATWTQRDSADRLWMDVASSDDGTKLVGVVYNGRIYTSTDSGANWTQRDSADRNWTGIASSADGTKLVGVVNNGRIYTSTDSGVNWTQRDTANREWWAVASSADGTKLVAVGNSGIFTSTDSGASWTNRGFDTATTEIPWLDVASSDDGTVLVAVGSGVFTSDGVLVSTDSGVNWSLASNSDTGGIYGGFRGVALSGGGAKIAVTATADYWPGSSGGRIFVSDDGGVNWTTKEATRFWGEIASSSDGSKLAATVWGGKIYTSECSGSGGGGAEPDCTDDSTATCTLDATRDSRDPEFIAANIASGVNILGVTGTLMAGGEECFDTWTQRDSARVWSGVAASSDGTKLAATVYGGRIYTSTDGGANWTQRDSNRNWRAIASSNDGTKLVAVVLGGRPYTSTDSGATWTRRDSANRNWADIASSADGTKLVGVVENGRIYASTDSGATWTQRDTVNREWVAVASSADGSKLAAAVYGGLIYVSTDSGVTWAPTTTADHLWNDIASSADGATLLATEATPDNTGDVFLSTDSGVTWTAQLLDSPWARAAVSADGARLVAVGAPGATYVSDDGGATWRAHGPFGWWRSAIALSGDGSTLVTVSGYDGEDNDPGPLYASECP